MLLLAQAFSYSNQVNVARTPFQNMVVIQEVVSKRSMDFANLRKAYLPRHVKKVNWERIADQVVNVSGYELSWVMARDNVQDMSVAEGRRKFKYSNCGRMPWK